MGMRTSKTVIAKARRGAYLCNRKRSKKSMRMNLTATVLAALATLAASTGGEAQEHTTETKGMENKKVLVAYFSRAGENWAVGNIEVGNTRIVADIIAAETGAAEFQIETVAPYPTDYQQCIDIAKREMNAKTRPAIKGDAPVEDYDVVFIGYPNWWGDVPMAVYTFLEKHEWDGKTVVPFCTHEGSGLGSTVRKIGAAMKGAKMEKGLAVRGATAQNSRHEAEAAVKAWLKSLSL